MEKKSPIAVVGMAGIFPGAGDLKTFWHNITNKVDATREVAKNRWVAAPEALYHSEPSRDKAYSKRSCLIADFKCNPSGIDLDISLLNTLDPLFHIVLHTGKTAIAQCHTASINRERMGVSLAAIALPTDGSALITRNILGTAFEEKLFGAEIADTPDESLVLTRNQCLSARVSGFPAAILARGLNLCGGTFTLDAACASSIYAVKLACDELNTGRADVMLAGGVSRPDALFTQVGFSQLQALSASGRCAPFDESADGLVVGEGAGIVALKRLDDALRDQDTIYGLIRGIGLSNDIKGNLLSPDSEGQIRAMKQAYLSASWSLGDIDYIECHGAGTPVGDAVELQSLHRLWEASGRSLEQCSIGSVKSMIGHLLTGAGAAGMIKTLLAIRHKTLPPSLNFSRASKNSPLHDSPFHVQTEPEKWTTRDRHTPRRAGVSAFGFGGINAHLLLEEWTLPAAKTRQSGLKTKTPGSEAHGDNRDKNVERRSSPISISDTLTSGSPVAIIGMDTAFGSITSLRTFQETIFKGDSIIGKRPLRRWKGIDAFVGRLYGLDKLSGGFMDKIDLHIGAFHIPPVEIPDILPQQLLMLNVSANAMKDAGLSLTGKRPRMGTIIGIGFDFEATNFHLRWNLYKQVEQWNRDHSLGLDKNEINNWRQSLMDEYGPPLTSSRTLGNLGSIVASRIAREFQFGGPSFSVSNEEASGLKAVEIGLRFLQHQEMDAVLVGAVDLFGDVRNIITRNSIHPFSKLDSIRPFDSSADGTLPGEGAAAVVLKRLEDAIRDGDRIYSVIKGVGKAGDGASNVDRMSKKTYMNSMAEAFSDSGISSASVSMIETHGSGDPDEDLIETEALNQFFSFYPDSTHMCAIGSVKPNIGHTGAVAGLASLVKIGLCLFQEIIPPLNNYLQPKSSWNPEKFHMPAFPQYWIRNKEDGPRRAVVCAMTTDGNCMHVVLEGMEYTARHPLRHTVSDRVARERKKPLGFMPHGLFVVEANSKRNLMHGLDRLSLFLSQGPERSQPMEALARIWHKENPLDPEKTDAISVVANNLSELHQWIAGAKHSILHNKPVSANGAGGFIYSPEPLGRTGRIAFVFPGSGNHYIGMGRTIGTIWPDIFRKMDDETQKIKNQMLPNCYVPWRTAWNDGWEQEAYEKIISDPLHMIFGQVVHGSVITRLVQHFGIRPSAVIGYSLGQSAGYFATGVWPDRGEMLDRLMETDLFKTELAGPCNAARKAWNVPPGEDVSWRVAVVNRPADMVRNTIPKNSTARLLIINTPEQCVLGGREPDVVSVISALDCESVFLDGIMTVHCDAAEPVAEAYKALHLFPVTPSDGVTFYSCADGRAHKLTSDSAASSICKQALQGFDFPQTIRQAYKDGIRIFLEMGPHASCTGMIRSILENQPHLAVSSCFRGENDYLTILKFLGTLIAQRVPVNLSSLYGDLAYPIELITPLQEKTGQQTTIAVGGKSPAPTLPGIKPKKTAPETKHAGPRQATGNTLAIAAQQPFKELIASIPPTSEAINQAHETFLALSTDIQKNYARTFDFQNRLLGVLLSNQASAENRSFLQPNRIEKTGLTLNNDGLLYESPPPEKAAFSREMCMEFAIGSVARVLGPEFSVVDTYKKRVRLPDEPLMLVDRIISVEGKKGSLSSGRIVTEHDVIPGAWYLDGGKAPVCISVEAGQADLFLCSYLGIDHRVKGTRAYRLLDASVVFHRDLPAPGDTIRYEIEIDKFVRQGETYLFFFHFKGYIGDSHLITMTEGCAGFFTEEEVKNSAGIILTEADQTVVTGKKNDDWKDFVHVDRKAISDKDLDALRNGDLGKCFGGDFEGIELAESLRLPGGPMRLIDRILMLDPTGGRYGLGRIRAEADIHPDDWFLTCHFMDDMVMPGTLMYECCAHTLRIFIQQAGWITDIPGACYEPVTGVKSILKCRGPVTPETRHVQYEVEIKETGYNPEPYVIADAHMFADGHRIVLFKDMSLKLTGVTRRELEVFWRKQRRNRRASSQNTAPRSLFNREKLVEFALGKPSRAFGEPYQVFDDGRFIARLPSPPFLFIDRIVHCEPKPWVLKPGGWIEAAFDVTKNDWYFFANRSISMPYCVLLEIALQSCGWLAAYMGSALKSNIDLRFRNLGGNGVLYQDIRQEEATLTIRARLKKTSIAGDMIIEQFEFILLKHDTVLYKGNTTFGFFTQQSLARQVGIRDTEKRRYILSPEELKDKKSCVLRNEPPLSPKDSSFVKNIHPPPFAVMPAKALLMIDEIEAYLPHGGPYGLGFIRGIKHVDPDEWFFKSHFYQDPVCPGSLGIESFIQLLKFAALDRWNRTTNQSRFEMVTKMEHQWTYRGQIVPENKMVEVEAIITEITDDPNPTLIANGFLKVDGRYIYEMENYGIKMVSD